jgi:Tfp pilus assembly protein PilE
LEKAPEVLRATPLSLVELIIVIAIMAALIAILARSIIKYVEKSRVAADETVAAELLQAQKWPPLT